MRGACTGPFAGKPAPTGTAQVSDAVRSLWERVYPRKGPSTHHKFARQSLYHDKWPQGSCFNVYSASTYCFFSSNFHKGSD
ncbi:conserved protein of unknown function [Pseudomonas sp. JV551A1]|uniref:Uncharacterized protein n=1 Tax=Pseudomonas inefficax TaxID=2078786 RepID=A0AAQ1P565_9PSED|nr:conserved protein of unknown function [Pseudomonas sp. JV551A1]SPO59478.1 conserved protein of unknown function [Pseudomonas inefficax]